MLMLYYYGRHKRNVKWAAMPSKNPGSPQAGGLEGVMPSEKL